MATPTTGVTVHLDEGQRYALQELKNGKSVALIGGAGCGKTFLLHRLMKEAEVMKGGYPYVVACGYSNRTASALNGVTFHKLFGAKASWEFSMEYLWKQVNTIRWIKERLEKIEVLIMDEISVLRCNEIDAIDFVLRRLAKSEWHSSLPFGGRIIIAAGDPYQLEPYEEEGTRQVEASHTFFQSRAWYLTFGAPGDGVVAILKNNHRQAKDRSFFDMLNRIRTEVHSPEDIQRLNKTSECSAVPPETYTRLRRTREQVRRVNESTLNKIAGRLVKFRACDRYFVAPRKALESRLASTAQTEVAVKVGAFVILTRQHGSARPGSQGVILGIRNETRHQSLPRFEIDIKLTRSRGGADVCDDAAPERVVTVGFEQFDIHGYDRRVIATRAQVPIIPGYALTVQRSQGMTMSHVAIDFEAVDMWRPCGIVYVALSRCRSKAGLWVKNLHDRRIRVSQHATALMFELWTLRQYIPSRISGVSELKCLGIFDHYDSDQTEGHGNEEKLIELRSDTDSTPSVLSVENLDEPGIVQGRKKRCFVWERKQK